MSKKRPHFVAIGGGTGTFTVLSALKKHNVRQSAIISVADDGKSSGILRDQYGVLPPGDVRRALVALSDASDTLRELFTYRFSGGDLDGHSFGNLFLSALEKIKGNFGAAVEEASRILNVKGEVIPVTLDDVRLYARLTDGTVLKGETNIDIPKRGRRRAAIERVWLHPKARINPRAAEAIAAADVVVIGPGDLYTSIIPNLLVRGVPEAIRSSRAKKVYVCNLMTKHGETDAFTAQDFLKVIERYAGRNAIDAFVLNVKKPSDAILDLYKEEHSEFVSAPALVHRGEKPRYILEDIIDRKALAERDPKKHPLVRHDPYKLARILLRCAAVE